MQGFTKLTDDKTAETLKRNVEGLQAKGFEIPIDYLRYIKLNQFEQDEERKQKCFVNYCPDEWYE